MDLLRKLTEELSPLGGELLIDRFLEARRAAAPPPATRPAPMKSAPGAQAAAPRADQAPATPPTIEPTAEGVEITDSGRLRLEVEAFLNRDQAEGTDDSEVQEFLKDRSGFDPSDSG